MCAAALCACVHAAQRISDTGVHNLAKALATHSMVGKTTRAGHNDGGSKAGPARCASWKWRRWIGTVCFRSAKQVGVAQQGRPDLPADAAVPGNGDCPPRRGAVPRRRQTGGPVKPIEKALALLVLAKFVYGKIFDRPLPFLDRFHCVQHQSVLLRLCGGRSVCYPSPPKTVYNTRFFQFTGCCGL
jgi:hypothetical protein